MQSITQILLAGLIVSCIAVCPITVLSQTTCGEYEIPPPIILPKRSHFATTGGVQVARNVETYIMPTIYDENGEISIDSCGPVWRLGTESTTKAGIRNMILFLKRAKPNSKSSHVGVYLHAKHLKDEKFHAELKSLLPNCAFFDAERDPWRKFLHEHDWNNTKSEPVVGTSN